MALSVFKWAFFARELCKIWWLYKFVSYCLFTQKDPEAKKPEDWDDREKIDDPEDSKPEDWDQPEHVADPDAKKPDDWDDEMDGEWEPPMIDNPDYKVSYHPPPIWMGTTHDWQPWL